MNNKTDDVVIDEETKELNLRIQLREIAGSIRFLEEMGARVEFGLAKSLSKALKGIEDYLGTGE